MRIGFSEANADTCSSARSSLVYHGLKRLIGAGGEDIGNGV